MKKIEIQKVTSTGVVSYRCRVVSGKSYLRYITRTALIKLGFESMKELQDFEEDGDWFDVRPDRDYIRILVNSGVGRDRVEPNSWAVYRGPEMIWGHGTKEKALETAHQKSREAHKAKELVSV
jgi:hypothetical protein